MVDKKCIYDIIYLSKEECNESLNIKIIDNWKNIKCEIEKEIIDVYNRRIKEIETSIKGKNDTYDRLKNLEI